LEYTNTGDNAQESGKEDGEEDDKEDRFHKECIDDPRNPDQGTVEAAFNAQGILHLASKRDGTRLLR